MLIERIKSRQWGLYIDQFILSKEVKKSIYPSLTSDEIAMTCPIRYDIDRHESSEVYTLALEWC